MSVHRNHFLLSFRLVRSCQATRRGERFAGRSDKKEGITQLRCTKECENTRIRHTREGGYPRFLKNNGFPTTTSGMTRYGQFRCLARRTSPKSLEVALFVCQPLRFFKTLKHKIISLFTRVRLTLESRVFYRTMMLGLPDFKLAECMPFPIMHMVWKKDKRQC